MNNEELLQTADAMRAFVEGKPVQCKEIGCESAWLDNPDPAWKVEEWLYRPKPQPKRVQWSNPEHVPGPVCWLRKLNSEYSERMIVIVAPHGVYVAGPIGEGAKFLPFNEIGKYEHSTDRATWHSCEIEEQ